MAFKLKSGNASSFKNLGSSPAKHKSDETHFHDKEGKVDYRGYDKADLFLRGKTKDKEGNIKDIKWAPTPKEKSPAKAKGDNLKRIATEKKALAKKTGTWYKPGAEPKVKVPNVKGFNVKGSSWPVKTPGYSSTKAAKAKMSKKGSMPKNFNVTGSSKAGKFAKWAKKGGKFLGGKSLGILGMMMGTTSKADQPTQKQGGGKIPMSDQQIMEMMRRNKLLPSQNKK